MISVSSEDEALDILPTVEQHAYRFRKIAETGYEIAGVEAISSVI